MKAVSLFQPNQEQEFENVRCNDERSVNMPSERALVRCSLSSAGYISNHLPKKAIDVFHQVRAPDDVLFILLFNACAKLADDGGLQTIRAHSSSLPSSWTSNVHVTNSLLNALIKCGDCERAEKIFRKTAKSVIGYGNLMNGFNDAKEPEHTLALYKELKTSEIAANEVIFLLVIQALSQVKIGRIARDIISEMPKVMQKDRSIQTSLISMWVSCLASMVSDDRVPVPSYK